MGETYSVSQVVFVVLGHIHFQWRFSGVRKLNDLGDEFMERLLWL